MLIVCPDEINGSQSMFTAVVGQYHMNYRTLPSSLQSEKWTYFKSPQSALHVIHPAYLIDKEGMNLEQKIDACNVRL